VGGGAPTDFYIDVFQPTGDQYVRPLAGNPDAAEVLRKAVKERGTFNQSDLGQNFSAYYGPMTKKLEKYSGSRGRSPMLGLVMYFTVSGNQYVGPIVAHLHSLEALDCCFGISHHCGEEIFKSLVSGVVQGSDVFNIVVLPMEQAMSFLLWLVNSQGNQKCILLINDRVIVDPQWKRHPVIKWLHRLKMTPAPILDAQIRDRLGRSRKGH